MTRIFNESDCKKCDACVNFLHHWIVCMFVHKDTGDLEYREDVEKWWEENDGSVSPMYWSCKHCEAWTPYDPEEHCCECLGELETEAEQEAQLCEACLLLQL